MAPQPSGSPTSNQGTGIVFKIFLALPVIISVILLGGLMYLYSLQPEYSGRIKLSGLRYEVEVIFDEYAIPHIFGQNEEDVYFALGFVHARERLFQMEMMRRVAAGRLSEIFGEQLVKTDKFFRTLGLLEQAEINAALFFKDIAEPWQKAALAYLEGVNRFIETNDPPIEFRILGIVSEKFTPRDIYLTGALMAFGFAAGFQTDPLVTEAYQKLGWKYLKDWAFDQLPEAQKFPVRSPIPTWEAKALATSIAAIRERLPVPAWIGSNGWVVAGWKTESGKVMFANDTHMLYSQPSVWYEAHLECPAFSFYGNYAAGVPFALIGHNRYAAWGLTMFENDDVDFYRERLNPDNPHQVWFIDHWENLKIRREAIKVKGSADVVFEVRTSRHGPILNEVDEKIARGAREPVAAWWVVNRPPMNAPQAFYRLSHVRSMEDARQAAAMIDVVGLNVLYGDRDGNIAWWAAGRLIKRPKHVNSKLFLDGASGRDEPLGFYDFSQNPRSENPSSGFVYSANNQPSLSSGILYPGYYVPEDRARRITEFLNSDTVWSTESMQQMTLDCTSDVFVAVTREVLKTLENESVLKMTPAHELAYRILLNWQGDHQITDAAPTIFYTLLANIMENSMADELGMESFRAIVSSHLIKRTIPDFIKNDPSLWWDDIHTAEIKETRRMIFARSFDQAVRLLISKIGREPADWYWGKVHTLEHPHLLGRQKPLDAVFNVGPFKAMGGNETIANLGFRLNSPGNYPVVFGPAMRIILDFADIENSLSVNPTGQSGYFLSPHYADQSRLFNAGRLRKQMMNREEITKSGKGTLILMPD